MDIQDRARGALLGMAVGEAMGAPLEGLSPEEIEEKVGRITGYLDADKTQPEHRAGFFTHSAYEDETQAALATAETLVIGDGFSVEELKSRFEELGRPVEGNVFGCYRRARRNFRTAVRRMLGGAPWKECGVNTAGSGAASRGIPIGVWFRDDREGRLRAAVEATLLTHRDPRACAATASVAEITALVMGLEDGAQLDADAGARAIVAAATDAEALMESEYADVLYPGYEPYLHQFGEAVAILPELVQLDIEPAFARIIEEASDKGSRPITHATRGFALTAVVCAQYLFLTGLDSYEDCLLDTICEGGNTDTLGCLVGGLSGALHGVTGIPDAWRAGLKNADHVSTFGAALAGAVGRGELGSLILTEARVTEPAPPQRRKRTAAPPPQRGGGQRRHGGDRRGGGGPRRGRGGGGPRRGPGGGGPRRDGDRDDRGPRRGPGGGGGPRRGPGGGGPRRGPGGGGGGGPRREGGGGGPRRGGGGGGGGPRRGPGGGGPRRGPGGGGPRRDRGGGGGPRRGPRDGGGGGDGGPR